MMQMKLFQKSRTSYQCLNHVMYKLKSLDCNVSLYQRWHYFDLSVVKFDYSKKGCIVKMYQYGVKHQAGSWIEKNYQTDKFCN
jgi:hypothetical protein